MGFINIIAKLFENVIARIFTAFGFSFVSFTGYGQAIDMLKNGVSGLIGGLPADVAALLYMSGIGEGLGYVVGAMVFIMSMGAINRFMVLGAS